MARDLTPPAERTPEERAADAAITESDLVRAEQTANQKATPFMQQLLGAKKDTTRKPRGRAP